MLLLQVACLKPLEWILCHQVSPGCAKVLLHSHHWKLDDVIQKHRMNGARLLIDSKIAPVNPVQVCYALSIQGRNYCTFAF